MEVPKKGRVATQTEKKDEETSASKQSGKTKIISKAAGRGGAFPIVPGQEVPLPQGGTFIV